MDKINWSKLKQANGNASHIPSALEKLKSPNPAQRKEAYWLLENYIVVQGGIYEAAYYTIPFLIELIEQRSNGKLEAYNLLIEILAGYEVDGAVIVINGISTALNLACRRRIANSEDIFFREILLAEACWNYALSVLALLAENYPGIIDRMESNLPTIDIPQIAKAVSEQIQQCRADRVSDIISPQSN